jgi:hypothetical protein
MSEEEIAKLKDAASGWRKLCLDMEEQRDRLLAAIKKHRNMLLRHICWREDAELYDVAGISPVMRQLPAVEEHRQMCDEYRSTIYGTAIEEEPCAVVARLQKIVDGHSDRIAAQSELLSRNAEKDRQGKARLEELGRDNDRLQIRIRELRSELAQYVTMEG